VLEDANLRGYQQRITDLKREYALLTTTLTADYPKVKKVQAQINEMEVALRRETEAVVQRIKSEYDASVRREQLLSGSYAAQLGAVSNQSDKAVEYGLLKREVDILRQTLNSMLQQSNQASILTAAPTANVRVIDQARPPAEPFKPVPLSTGAYSVGIGLVSGAALSLLLESLRRHRNQSTFNLPGRSSQLLSVPELGVIPSSKVDPTLQFIWVSYSARRKTLRIPWPPRFVRRFMKKLRRRTDPSSRIELISWYRRGSMLAESFRSVFASLRLMDRRGRLPQVIVLSSPGPSEGKTTVITNLAIAMADSGRRVLLVDADCRRPRLHEVFDLNNDAGLSDLLVNPARLASDAAPPIQATQVPNLHLLAAGSLSGEELVHLLDSPNLLSLLGLLRQQFDVILVDTPPMLAFSEARLLGQHSDGMILLLRARSTHVETALAAKSRVLGDGTRLLGIVLNDWRPAGGSARYYCGPENYYHRQTSTVHP
jgi:capsular exopolysaccharide synthesis family protein